MDEKKAPLKYKQSRPAIEKVDCSLDAPESTYQAFNGFMVRLQMLRSKMPSWNDPKNQNRPFKQSFIDFAEDLVCRLPIAPEMVPTYEGNILLRYTKHAPRDKWQRLEIVIYPQRHFSLTARSRVPHQEPFTRTNIARPDILADVVRSFYENDSVNTQDHPIRYRKATPLDYPILSGMCNLTFGPQAKFHPKKIDELLEYCIVADDPMYGIVAFAGFGKSPKSGDFAEVEYTLGAAITVECFRGLGIGGKCIRKAITNLLIAHPDVMITAKVPLEDGEMRDNCRGILTRSGFYRVKIVRGEDKYINFSCDHCNICNGFCEFRNSNSLCSTVYYVLGDNGGKQGYGGRKEIE